MHLGYEAGKTKVIIAKQITYTEDLQLVEVFRGLSSKILNIELAFSALEYGRIQKVLLSEINGTLLRHCW